MNDQVTPIAPTLPLTDLWRLALTTIQAVEAVYPESGRGKEKFDVVYSQVMAYAPLVSVSAELLDRVLPVFINGAVSLFNRIGAFKKT